MWEDATLPMSKEFLVEVEHVKAHRTKKDKNKMSNLKSLSLMATRRRDELATEGAMLDEGFMAETRAKTVQQERERRGICSLAVRSKLSLLGGRMERL